jgi:hypothetical protein
LSKANYKTPEQIEFAALVDQLGPLYGKKGLQAFIARELTLSPAAISTYYKGGEGKSSPSARSLADMRDLVNRFEAAKTKGEEIERRFGRLEQLHEDLAFLEKADPPSFDAAGAAIEAFTKSVRAKPSSTTGHPKVVKVAAQSGVAEVLSGRHKRRAAKSTGNKLPSIPRSHPETASPPPPPGQHPKQH